MLTPVESPHYRRRPRNGLCWYADAYRLAFHSDADGNGPVFVLRTLPTAGTVNAKAVAILESGFQSTLHARPWMK